MAMSLGVRAWPHRAASAAPSPPAADASVSSTALASAFLHSSTPRFSAGAAQASSSGRPGAIAKGAKGRSFVGCRASLVGGGSGALTPELKEALDSFVGSNKVVLFMKGNRNFPQCGFSNTCIQILNQCQVPYETVNILEDESLRQGVKEYSMWPTYPQLYIDGEFYGGCDITLEAFRSGELKEALDKALIS